MLSRKRYNYQLRMFVPIAAILWVFAIGLGVFHYHRSMVTRADALHHDLDHITNFIRTTYNDSTLSMQGSAIRDSYLQFLDTFYSKTDLEDIYISVFDQHTGKVIRSNGSIELPAPVLGLRRPSERMVLSGKVKMKDRDGNYHEMKFDTDYYYKCLITDDQRYIIQSFMPFRTQASATTYSVAYLWVLFISTLIMTAFMYLYTSHLSRNIVALRDFVDTCFSGEEVNMNLKFADDELGDISRQILQIYEMRQQNMADLEQEHQIALRATKERNEMRQQLTNNINHELKTPIGIIKGYIETLLDNPDMEPEIREHFLNKCSRQIARLTDMMSDLSTMTRLEGGAANISTEKLDFGDIVESAFNDLADSGVCGSMTSVPEVPKGTFIKGNFNLLNNLLGNFSKNAVAYSQGTQFGIKLIAKNKRFYSFSFWDNGKGIPEEYLPRIFERFFRVDSGRSRKNGGTGLGLPIVKTTVTTLGGTISVRNRKEGGLEFIFTLPVWNEEEDND